jgi:hypothetical protein
VPRRLGDGVEPGECAVDHREVQVHARLDQLGADDLGRDARREPGLAAGNGLEVEVDGSRVEDLRRRTIDQGLLQLAAGVLARKALVQAAVPVVEPGVVSGDEVAQHASGATKALFGVQRPRCRVPPMRRR